MPNNTISQVKVNGTTYDLLDANTLSTVSDLESRVTSLENSVANVPTAIANAATAINRVNNGDTGMTFIDTLSSTSQLTHAGWYSIGNCAKLHNDFWEYDVGDFKGLLLSTHFENNKCRFGTLILTTPRRDNRIWFITIWEFNFTAARFLVTTAYAPLFKTQTIARTINLSGNGYGAVPLNPPVEDGYTFVGIRGYYLSNTYIYPYQMDSNWIGLRNINQSTGDTTIYVDLLYIRNL